MITLSKIAKLAHVSVSTVSKAFSDSSDINPDTRDKILAIAKEYGCFKKYYRAKYPKTVVAVICPEFKSRYYSAAPSALQEQLECYNCEICVASTDFDPGTEAALLEYYDSYTAVDAVILIDGRTDCAGKYGLPVISVGAHCGCDISVVTDITDSLREAVDRFLSNGITDIGFIGETHTKSKLLALRSMCDIKEKYISITDKRFEEGGYSAMQSLIDNGNVPRAVICAYDYMAIGAMRCIFDNGLRVPEDIAVMGFDNIPESRFLNPPLASVDPNIDTACKLAARLLVRCISSGDGGICENVRSRLYFRASADQAASNSPEEEPTVTV